jgi:hypothetical protein
MNAKITKTMLAEARAMNAAFDHERSEEGEAERVAAAAERAERENAEAEAAQSRELVLSGEEVDGEVVD